MTSDLEPGLLPTLAFYAASVTAITSALNVVFLRDLIRAVVSLAVSFVAVAAIFFTLNAEFVGIVQVLVYVGAVTILIAFAVMFVRDLSEAGSLERHAPISAVVALAIFAAIVFVAYNTEWTGIEEVRNPDASAALVGTFAEVKQDDDFMAQAVGDGADGAQGGVLVDSSGPIGALIIRNFLLPFETLGLLMVASVIGALMVIRSRRTEGSA